MPSALRLLWPFLARVATKSGRIYRYAAHPEKAPLSVRYAICRNAARSLILPFRIKLVVKGVENLPAERVLFCPNHQSDMDCVVALMANPKPAGILAKVEVSRMPVIDGVLRALSGDYLCRGFPLSELRTLKAISQKLEEDTTMSYFIFPEGTRTPDVIDHSVGAFKSGAFRVALEARLPIVPMAIFATYTLLDFKAPDRKVYPVQITFLPPIPYAEYERMKPQQIADLVRTRVVEEVDRMREEQPRLEAYWNRKENVKRFKKEAVRQEKEDRAIWRKERKQNRILEKKWRLTHPLLARNRRPKITREQKAMIEKFRSERRALVAQYRAKALKAPNPGKAE